MRNFLLFLIFQHFVLFVFAQKPQIVLPIGHNSSISCAEFSDDNNLLATGSYDHSIKIWEVKSGILLKTLNKHQEKIENIAFSQNGNTLFSYSIKDSLGVFWNLFTGEIIGILKTNYYEISPDHQFIAIKKNQDNSIRIYEFETGKIIGIHSEPLGKPWSFHFSKDSKILVAHYHYDYNKFDKDEYVEDNSNRILFFSFSPFSKTKEIVSETPRGKIEMLDENNLYAIIIDKGISIFSAKNGNLKETILANTYIDRIIDDSSEGILIGIYNENIVMVYNYAKSKLIYNSPEKYSGERRVLSNTCKYFAHFFEFGSGKETRINTILDNRNISELACANKSDIEKTCEYQKLFFSKDDRYLVPFKYSNLKYYFINTITGKIEYSIVAPTLSKGYNQVIFSKTGNLFFIYNNYSNGNGSGIIGKIGEPASTKILPYSKVGEQKISFTSNDSAFVLMNNNEGSIWDLYYGKLIGKAGNYELKQIFISPTGGELIKVNIINPENNYTRQKINLTCTNLSGDKIIWTDEINDWGYDHSIPKLVFSNSGDKFSLIKNSHKVFIYQVKNGIHSELIPPSIDVPPIFSPNGNQLLFYGTNNGVFTGKYPKYNDPTLSEKKTTSINLLTNGIMEYKGSTNAEKLAYSPTGKYIYTVNPILNHDFLYWEADNPQKNNVLKANKAFISATERFWLFDSTSSPVYEDCWLLNEKNQIKFIATAPICDKRFLSQDGNAFIESSVYSLNNRALIWDVNSGSQQKSFFAIDYKEQFDAPILSNSGVYQVFKRYKKLSVFESSNSTPIIEIEIKEGYIDPKVHFSKDNLFMGVYSHHNQELKLWNLKEKKIVGTILSNDKIRISSTFCFSNRKNLLATFDLNSSNIEIYSTADLKKPLYTLKNIIDNQYLDDITFLFDSLDESLTILNNDDGSIKKYSLFNRSLLSDISYKVNKTRMLSISPNGQWVSVFSGSDSLTIFSKSGERKFQIHLDDKYYNYQLYWILDGKYFLLLHENTNAVLYETVSFKIISNFVDELGIPEEIFVLPDGKQMIYCNLKGENLLVDVLSKKITHEFTGHTDDLINAEFSRDDSILLTYGKDQKIVIWDLINGNSRISFTEHSGTVNDVCFNKNDTKFLSASSDNTLRYWNTNAKKSEKIFVGHNGPVNACSINHINKNAISTSDDGTTKLWDIESGKEIATFISVSSEDYLTVTPDQYYFGSKNAAKNIGYTIGLSHYSFDQFDLKYNRPDLVLKQLGNKDTLLINLYHDAYLKRLKKMNFTEKMFSDSFHIPSLEIVEINNLKSVVVDSSYLLKVKVEDSKILLDRINIFVNEVPIYGSNGLSLRGFKSKSIIKEIKLILSNGNNKIQVSCLNQAGAESYKATYYVTYTPITKTKQNLIFIGIGIDKYQQHGYDLQYSTKDIRDLAIELKKKFGQEIIIDTLFNEQVTRQNILALKRNLMLTNVNDKVIVSFSGHGLLDDKLNYYLATNHVDFKNPSENGIPYDDLEWLMDSIPARKKLLLIDACNSGEVDKEELLAINSNNPKGAKGAEVIYEYKPKVGLKNSFELMQELFANVSKGTGSTIISASGGTQFAYENGALNNGVFTYSILELMQKEPHLKLSELKNKVGERVVQLTHGLQKPTSRSETIDFDWEVW